MIRVVAVLCIFIVALDAVESVISKASGMPYAWFMPMQLVVYIGVGFVLRRRGASVRDTAIAVAATALVEATAGEWVAVAIGASPAVPLAVQAVVVPIAVVVESGLGLAGFALGSIGRTGRA